MNGECNADLKRAVRDQQHLFNASVVLIEDKASGTQLIQDPGADIIPRWPLFGSRLTSRNGKVSI